MALPVGTEEGALVYLPGGARFAEALHGFLRDAEGGAALNADTDVDLDAAGSFHRPGADGAIWNGLTRVGRGSGGGRHRMLRGLGGRRSVPSDSKGKALLAYH